MKQLLSCFLLLGNYKSLSEGDAALRSRHLDQRRITDSLKKFLKKAKITWNKLPRQMNGFLFPEGDLETLVDILQKVIKGELKFASPEEIARTAERFSP